MRAPVSRRQAIQGVAGLASLASLGLVGASARATEPERETVRVSHEYVGPPLHRATSSDNSPFQGTGADVQRLLRVAKGRSEWDFNYALGDTIREKYQDLYRHCLQVSEEMVRQGASGYFYMICSPEVSSIFEVSSSGFIPTPYDKWRKDGQYPMGVDMGVQNVGVVAGRWRLYKTHRVDVDEMLIGVGPVDGPSHHFDKVTIRNFIV